MMLIIAISIIAGCALIADAIMFVHGYKGYFYGATTDQEKAIRQRLFNERNLQWDEKE